MSELHPSIVALVALSAHIAANHPKQGLCQVDKLRSLGVPEAHLQAVIEIARHIRDEASETLDATFDEQIAAPGSGTLGPTTESTPKPKIPKGTLLNIPVSSGACCSSTASGQSCC